MATQDSMSILHVLLTHTQQLEATTQQLTSLDSTVVTSETSSSSSDEAASVTTLAVTADRTGVDEDSYHFSSAPLTPTHNSSWLLAEAATPLSLLLHIYGSATLFIWLDLFIVLISLTSKKHVVRRPCTLTVLTLMGLFASSFAVFLILDPYGSRTLLPRTFITVVFYTKYMSFILVFWLIQRVLKSMSNIKQLSCEAANTQLQPATQQSKIGAFLPTCLVYLGVMVTLASVTSLKPHLQILHLITQAIYVTFMIVLSFTFLYSALNISQYTKQTTRVLDETIIYSKMQSKLREKGRPCDPSLDLYRVKRDRLHFHNDPSASDGEETNSRRHKDSDSSSNESLAFYNHVALFQPSRAEEMCQQQEGLCIAKQLDSSSGKQAASNGNQVSKNLAKITSLKNNYIMLESPTDCDITENDNVNVLIDRVTKRHYERKHNHKKTKNSSKSNKTHQSNSSTVFHNRAFFTDSALSHQRKADTKSDGMDSYSDNKMSNWIPNAHNCHSRLNALSQGSSGPQKILQTNGSSDDTDHNSIMSIPMSALLEGKCQGNSNGSVQCYTATHHGPSVPIYSTYPRDQRNSAARCLTEDTGYLADTEHTHLDDAKDDVTISDTLFLQTENQPGNCDDNTCQLVMSPVLPPRGHCYLGLHRVRKGRCVQRMMYTTYCTTVFAFVLSVLELYEMFSVKGVLAGHLSDKLDYTWLLFQTLLRMSEVGFAASICRSVQLWGKPRRHVVSKRRKPVYDDVQYTEYSIDTDSQTERTTC